MMQTLIYIAMVAVVALVLLALIALEGSWIVAVTVLVVLTSLILVTGGAASQLPTIFRALGNWWK